MESLSNLVSVSLTVAVDTNNDAIKFDVYCSNMSDVPLRVPCCFAMPDPFTMVLKGDDGQLLDGLSTSHTFSFLADEWSTKILSPGESLLVSEDLMECLARIDKGNYTLSITLNPHNYLEALRKKNPNALALDEYDVDPSNIVSFFVPWEMNSKSFDEALRSANSQKQRYNFRWWNPSTWYR